MVLEHLSEKLVKWESPGPSRAVPNRENSHVLSQNDSKNNGFGASPVEKYIWGEPRAEPSWAEPKKPQNIRTCSRIMTVKTMVLEHLSEKLVNWESPGPSRAVPNRENPHVLSQNDSKNNGFGASPIEKYYFGEPRAEPSRADPIKS